jgi:chaperone BCS1
MLNDIFSITQDGNLWAFVKEQLNSNQFSQGAIVAGIVMGIITWGKGIPGRIWDVIKKLTTIDMRYNSDSPDYDAISRYITSNVIRDTFSRNFVFQTETGFDEEKWREVAKQRGLTAGYGTHLGIYKGRPVLVRRFVDESSNTTKFKEHTIVVFLTRSKKTVYRFAEEIARAAGTNVAGFENVPIHINADDYWSKMGKLPLRRIDSVFTANNAGERVVDAIREFESKKEEHHRLGLPHHTGIMLHGEPGCGKSSLIHAVATETERSIYYLNLGSVEADKQLTKLLSGTRDWSKILLAIEDIDAAGVKVNRNTEQADGKKRKSKGEEKSPISLSALLNVLDGILCPDGLVVIATTNHHERLDPALIRPGRFDHTIELGKLGYGDFLRMARMFNRDPADFNVSNDTTMSGAEMRAMILEAA